MKFEYNFSENGVGLEQGINELNRYFPDAELKDGDRIFKSGRDTVIVSARRLVHLTMSNTSVLLAIK